MQLIESCQIGSVWTPEISFFHLLSRSHSVKSSEIRISIRFRFRSQVILCCLPRIVCNYCRRCFWGNRWTFNGWGQRMYGLSPTSAVVTMLQLAFGSLFWVELILTDFVGMKKLLVSVSSSVFSLMFSPVFGFSTSFRESMRKFLISEDISSFKKALKLSRGLFRSREILVLRDPQCLRPVPRNKDFLFLLLKLDLHLPFDALLLVVLPLLASCRRHYV